MEDALREIRRVESGEADEWVWHSNSTYTTVHADETTIVDMFGDERTHHVATDEFADFLERVIAAVEATA